MPNTPLTAAYPAQLDDDVSLTVGANNAPPSGTTAALNASIGTSDTTITATGCTNFPAANGIFTTGDGEIIYYAAMALSAGVYTFTGCLRGQDGSSAATHASGTVINVYETHGQRVVIVAAVKALQAKVGTGSSTPVASTFLKGTGTGTSAWSALSSGDVTTALGYTPVNAANATTFSAAGTALTVTNDISIGGRVITAGLIGLNGTTVNSSAVHVWGGVMSGSSQYGIELIPICSSGAVTAFYGLYVNTVVGNINFTQTNNYGMYIGNASKGALATITNAYGLYIEAPTTGSVLNRALHIAGGQTYFGGDVQAAATANFGPVLNGAWGIYQLGGAAYLQALARTTVTVTPVGATGATSYTYVVVAKDRAGALAPASAAVTITNGNATLNGTNYNQISWTPITGAVSYDVIKIAGGNFRLTNTTATTYNDQGAATNPYAMPAWNGTGDFYIDGALYLGWSGTNNAYPTTGGDPAPSPAAGSLWYNTVQKALHTGTPMGAAHIPLTLVSTWPTGDSVTGTLTETPFATNLVLPANSLVVSRTFRVTARGVYISTSTFTLQFVLRLTNGATHINLATAVAAAVTTAASPGFVWTIDAYVTVTALGSGTSALANCYLRRAWTTVANTSTANESVAGVWRGNAVGFDSTIQQTLELTAKWSSSTGTTATLEYFEVQMAE